MSCLSQEMPFFFFISFIYKITTKNNFINKKSSIDIIYFLSTVAGFMFVDSSALVSKFTRTLTL